MRRIAAALATLALLVACGGEPADPGPTVSDPVPTESAAPEGNGGEPEGVDTSGAIVFAAASLHEVFQEIADANYSFDGSSGLVDQMAGGAPADVFASADENNMNRAVEEGLIDGEPAMFATNYPVLVTPADNPADITGFDESLEGSRLVICAPDVPCGAATLRVSEAAGMTLTPVSEESSVTDVLGKVTSGEADAGLVYATDAAGAGDAVQVFEVPGAEDDPNTYWIAKVVDAPNPDIADAFIEIVLSDEGQAALAGYGFGPGR